VQRREPVRFPELLGLLQRGGSLRSRLGRIAADEMPVLVESFEMLYARPVET
jgi:hypothetical protein